MNDIKEHINCMATLWCIYGVLMDNAWTLEQGNY